MNSGVCGSHESLAPCALAEWNVKHVRGPVVPQLGFLVTGTEHRVNPLRNRELVDDHSHVPSACRRATSAVTLPSGRRVEVSSNSRLIMAGRWSPKSNF
jgi:hypothetical protein